MRQSASLFFQRKLFDSLRCVNCILPNPFGGWSINMIFLYIYGATLCEITASTDNKCKMRAKTKQRVNI
jgi:hypothetical protein